METGFIYHSLSMGIGKSCSRVTKHSVMYWNGVRRWNNLSDNQGHILLF